MDDQLARGGDHAQQAVAHAQLAVIGVRSGVHFELITNAPQARVEFERGASLTENVRERELLLTRAAECAAERMTG